MDSPVRGLYRVFGVPAASTSRSGALPRSTRPVPSALGLLALASPMQVIVNGKPMEVPEGVRIAGLLSLLGLEGKPAAVEVNRALVPKKKHEVTILSEGDLVEVVTLVGGG